MFHFVLKPSLFHLQDRNSLNTGNGSYTVYPIVPERGQAWHLRSTFSCWCFLTKWMPPLYSLRLDSPLAGKYFIAKYFIHQFPTFNVAELVGQKHTSWEKILRCHSYTLRWHEVCPVPSSLKETLRETGVGICYRFSVQKNTKQWKNLGLSWAVHA